MKPPRGRASCIAGSTGPLRGRPRMMAARARIAGPPPQVFVRWRWIAGWSRPESSRPSPSRTLVRRALRSWLGRRTLTSGRSRSTTRPDAGSCSAGRLPDSQQLPRRRRRLVRDPGLLQDRHDRRPLVCRRRRLLALESRRTSQRAARRRPGAQPCPRCLGDRHGPSPSGSRSPCASKPIGASAQEATRLRAAGIDVVLIEPTTDDLDAMGSDLMSSRCRHDVVQTAVRTMTKHLHDTSLGARLAEPPERRWSAFPRLPQRATYMAGVQRGCSSPLGGGQSGMTSRFCRHLAGARLAVRVGDVDRLRAGVAEIDVHPPRGHVGDRDPRAWLLLCRPDRIVLTGVWPATDAGRRRGLGFRDVSVYRGGDDGRGDDGDGRPPADDPPTPLSRNVPIDWQLFDRLRKQWETPPVPRS